MSPFFKQNVNQWLCILLISSICYWVVFYYLSNKAELIVNVIAADNFNPDR